MILFFLFNAFVANLLCQNNFTRFLTIQTTDIKFQETLEQQAIISQMQTAILQTTWISTEFHGITVMELGI